MCGITICKVYIPTCMPGWRENFIREHATCWIPKERSTLGCRLDVDSAVLVASAHLSRYQLVWLRYEQRFPYLYCRLTIR
jgi:hypothetical protein